MSNLISQWASSARTKHLIVSKIHSIVKKVNPAMNRNAGFQILNDFRECRIEWVSSLVNCSEEEEES